MPTSCTTLRRMQMREVFRIAFEKAGYGKMKAFAAGMLRELQ